MLDATMRRFTFDESGLAQIRYDLYSPSGPGFHLIRNFVPKDMMDHMRDFWTRPKPATWDDFPVLRNRPFYHVGEGPFASHTKTKDTYMFAPWNKPVDEVTASVALAMILLRTQIEQQPIYNDIFPCGPMVSFYMMIMSRHADEYDVKWHEDIFPHDEKYPYVENRLQCTLFVSEYGVDYTGTGMQFVDNSGNKMQADAALGTKPGDLLVFRFGNSHAIGSINTPENGIGFARMLIPVEHVKQVPPPSTDPGPPKPRIAQAPPAAPGLAARLLAKLGG